MSNHKNFRPTTILDTLPARVWLDRIDGPRGHGHGFELVEMFAGTFQGLKGEAGDPTRNASEVIDQLLRDGRIQQAKRPTPSREQIAFGTGGTFNVRGQGAPVVCWKYFRV